MGLIEQAVELLQRANVQRPVEPEPEPAQQSTGQLVRRREQPLPSNAPAEVVAVPCRGDRTIHIDIPALRTMGLVAPQDEERQLAAEYRIIKRPLLAGMTGEDRLRLGNIVVVTSALPNEGKTFTTINLALSLALERDREVLLVDGDVAKAHLTQLFGLDGEPGLLDLGAAGRELEETIVKTDYASLRLLPAGNKHAEATEILRSERVASLLASLAADPRRIVLIDAPPLLVTSEAGVVTSLAGQVVLVVKAAETPQEAVMRAIETIAEDKPVSLVLNHADAVQVHGYGYYGRYSYGRPDGASDGSGSGRGPDAA
jgi:exopolysaccharide/PEP-CTERM locus tyrosine autokinase